MDSSSVIVAVFSHKMCGVVVTCGVCEVSSTEVFVYGVQIGSDWAISGLVEVWCEGCNVLVAKSKLYVIAVVSAKLLPVL